MRVRETTASSVDGAVLRSLEQLHEIRRQEASRTPIEASRVAMTRFVKRGGKIWIRLFPDKPVTKKPAETRMGKGKGAPDHWVAVVRPGKILFEMEGVTPQDASEAMRLASHKLPLRTRFVKRESAAH